MWKRPQTWGLARQKTDPMWIIEGLEPYQPKLQLWQMNFTELLIIIRYLQQKSSSFITEIWFCELILDGHKFYYLFCFQSKRYFKPGPCFRLCGLKTNEILSNQNEWCRQIPGKSGCSGSKVWVKDQLIIAIAQNIKLQRRF